MVNTAKKNSGWVPLVIIAGFAVIAYTGYHGAHKKSKKVEGPQIPKRIWELLKESDKRSLSIANDSLAKTLEETYNNSKDKPSMWNAVMVAQAYESQFMREKALCYYIEAAKIGPSDSEPLIGIGQLCFQAAIFDMAEREKVEITQAGVPMMRPDKETMEILLLAKKFVLNAKKLRTNYKLVDGIPAYLFGPNKADYLLSEIESIIKMAK